MTYQQGLKLKVDDPGVIALVVPLLELFGRGITVKGSNINGAITPNFDQEITVTLELRPGYPPYTVYGEEVIARLVLVPLVYPLAQEVKKFS